MIQVKKLAKQVKKRTISVHFDLSGTANCFEFWFDPENATKVLGVDTLYVVATNTGTHAETIRVGTTADDDYYAIADPAASQTLGTLTHETLLHTGDLPAGTALVMRRSAVSGQTNTGEVVVQCHLQTTDRGNYRP